MIDVSSTDSPDEAEEEIPALVSPVTFHLEWPPYEMLDLSDPVTNRLAHVYIESSENVDAYCIYCKKESTFKPTNTPGWSWSSWQAVAKTKTERYFDKEYSCTRNLNHEYKSMYRVIHEELTKVGQYPSVADFQIPQAEKYRQVLGENEYRELVRGIGLAAHGVGIGAFIYLRRIFEKLISSASDAALADSKLNLEKFKAARMDEKIQMLGEYLPEFLVENRSLYAIMSKGVHQLSEDECLKYFQAVRIGIEQILDEKIEQKSKKEKAERARKAVAGVLKAVNPN